jgi:site-specific recombinase XerD
VRVRLRAAGYSRATLTVYRQVLRTMSRHWRMPGGITAEQVHDYLCLVNQRGASASWLMANISVIRTVFDKLGRQRLTTSLHSPRRGFRLPYVLSPEEIARLLRAAPTLRDQLLLGLIYGCGLKVGEACLLRWRDIRLQDDALRVASRRGTHERCLPIPRALRPLLAEGVRRCEPEAYLFPGSRTDRGLSTRAAEEVCKRAAKTAGLTGTVTCMTLRHTFAVDCLRAGMNVRELQIRLDHGLLDTTLIYCRMILPPIESPADRLAALSGFPNQNSPPVPTLPDLLPDLESLQLPFPPESPSRGGFREFMRTHIVGRFLAWRRARGELTPGHPG